MTFTIKISPGMGCYNGMLILSSQYRFVNAIHSAKEYDKQ